jgi:biopolymer transport protein TolQ
MFWSYFVEASWIVKAVIIILLLASVLSWTLIFERGWALYKMNQSVRRFKKRFSSTPDVKQLYQQINDRAPLDSMEELFCHGLKAYLRAKKQQDSQALQQAYRTMNIGQFRRIEFLEKHLSILATIGSTSPYIGLFGTVWGIMSTFHSLGTTQQVTIAMVAPGISEALIATAMGLFAAIPAVIAYNRYANEVERLDLYLSHFQEEFVTRLRQQAVAEETAL